MKEQYYMKRFLKSSLALSLLIINNLNSQTSKKTDSVYNDYFNLTREIPYLHLNKTTFIKGENLWFKAYVLNLNSNKLHKGTSNLYCSLFDKSGSLKDQKLLFVKNGVASGYFKIDSTFINKNYYIKASTNYMKNFVEDESYNQKITIINDNPDNITDKSELDFQLLPEGGHLIAHTNNSIGIAIKKYPNKGVKIKKGEILEDNKTIISFNTNDFGFSKVQIYIDPEKSYQSKITLENNTIITKELPKVFQKGINIIVKDLNNTQTQFTFNTNKNTLTDIINKKYYFLIHNTRHYIKEQINFKQNSLQVSYNINKKDLKAGTNIITLFNDKNIPIAERIFFNYKKSSLFSSINTGITPHNESFTLSISKTKNKPEKYFLSASILPFETKSYNPKNTIYTKFLLSPYIKGSIERPSYYFKDIDKEKLYDLDLLLLTQGWSKYNWNSIFNSPPKEQFSFDRGITIQGTINSKLPKGTNKIFLASTDNKIFEYQNLSNNTFQFNNLHLKNKSEFSLSLLKSNKNFTKFKPYIRYPNKNINFSENNFYKINSENQKITSTLNVDSFIKKDYTILNEVNVKGKIKLKNKPRGTIGLIKGYKVEDLPFKNLAILDYLKYKGFIINESFGQVSISNGRGSLSFHFNPITKVFLDGIPLQTQKINNLDLISDSDVNDYEEIFISKTLQGEIHLYSETNLKSKKFKTPFLTFKVPLGYAKTKEYYQPKYNSVQSNIFKEYGAIYWDPLIEFNNKTYKKNIKFDYTNLDKVKVFIEGISENGSLISIEQTINLKK